MRKITEEYDELPVFARAVVVTGYTRFNAHSFTQLFDNPVDIDAIKAGRDKMIALAKKEKGIRRITVEYT